MFSFGKRSVVFVLILFIVIALVGWAWRQRDSLPFITKPLMTIMSPFEYGASRVMDSLTSSIHIVDISLKNRIEWESLEKENADLKSRTVDYDEVVAENDRLRALLNFKSSHNQYQLLAGSVISRDYGTWTNTMIIDVGSGEGVEKDMPVITPSGVVGFISDVYPHSARVQLLTDPRTSIGAIVQRPESRVSSVVRGNGNVPTEPQFVNIAKAYYAAQGRDIEIIKLNGSIELAPLLGLSDVIVDIVETGTTLRENNLKVITEFMPISARFIANRASYQFKRQEIDLLLEKLAEVTQG